MNRGMFNQHLCLNSACPLTFTLRVGYDKSSYNEFMQGFEPLVADDVADAAAFMLNQKDRVSVKAIDVVPTAQRSLQVFDREWNSRDENRKRETMD
jgi:3-hydroxy acid dehydrogenase/malonic semialdehyde reductase